MALSWWALYSDYLFLQIPASLIILTLLFIPFHSPKTVIVNDGIEKIFQTLNYLFNKELPTSYDESTFKSYLNYNTNIKYPANKNLMNEFRNKVDVEEKEIVIVGNMMWEKKPLYEEAISDNPLSDNPFYKKVHSLPKVSWKEANNHCNELTLQNFNDWRLPTRNELGQYYRNGIKVNFDKSMIFWSSTESEKDGYDYEGMSFNGRTYSVRGNGGYAICVKEL